MTRTIENNESIWFWKQKSEQVTSNPSLPSASGWHQFEKLMLRFFMIQFGARFQTEKEPQNASECQICITWYKIDVWNQIEILCCQSDWLGRAETQYFIETSSFYDIVFWNFFAKIFVNSKFQMVSHVEANDDMFSLFVRFFLIFGSFEQYWLKWNGHSHLQIVKRSLVGSKREAELPVPIFANKFFEKQHSPLWWV